MIEILLTLDADFYPVESDTLSALWVSTDPKREGQKLTLFQRGDYLRFWFTNQELLDTAENDGATRNRGRPAI